MAAAAADRCVRGNAPRQRCVQLGGCCRSAISQVCGRSSCLPAPPGNREPDEPGRTGFLAATHVLLMARPQRSARDVDVYVKAVLRRVLVGSLGLGSHAPELAGERSPA